MPELPGKNPTVRYCERVYCDAPSLGQPFCLSRLRDTASSSHGVSVAFRCHLPAHSARYNRRARRSSLVHFSSRLASAAPSRGFVWQSIPGAHSAATINYLRPPSKPFAGFVEEGPLRPGTPQKNECGHSAKKYVRRFGSRGGRGGRRRGRQICRQGRRDVACGSTRTGRRCERRRRLRPTGRRVFSSAWSGRFGPWR
jgi:hypothetical protein